MATKKKATKKNTSSKLVPNPKPAKPKPKRASQQSNGSNQRMEDSWRASDKKQIEYMKMVKELYENRRKSPKDLAAYEKFHKEESERYRRTGRTY
jgi:hypothetical protein